MKQNIDSLKIFTSLVCIFCIVSFQSCQDLPEKTQTGEGLIGMRVNGDEWVAGGINTRVEASYLSFAKGIQIQASITRKNTQQQLNIVVPNVISPGSYKMDNFPFLKSSNDSTRFWYDDNYYDAFKLKSGDINSIQITKFDTVKNIISGTFTVNLVNRNNETLKITEGRFDLILNIIN